MCKSCVPTKVPSSFGRRQLLHSFALGVGAIALAGFLPSQISLAAGQFAPPKPQNEVDPSLALKRLMEGNARYISGTSKKHDFKLEREALVAGQNPFAAVLSCADSRITPEYAFDSARGDIFAVRIAGNFVTNEGLASLEYSVAVLGTPLIMVLGHESCGAVGAAVKATQDKATFPGQIQGLAEALIPSVEKVLHQPGILLDNAIAQNVKDSVEKLKTVSPVINSAISKGELKIVGAVYRLASGRVELIV